jgi:hypothetical protein
MSSGSPVMVGCVTATCTASVRSARASHQPLLFPSSRVQTIASRDPCEGGSCNTTQSLAQPDVAFLCRGVGPVLWTRSAPPSTGGRSGRSVTDTGGVAGGATVSLASRRRQRFAEVILFLSALLRSRAMVEDIDRVSRAMPPRPPPTFTLRARGPRRYHPVYCTSGWGWRGTQVRLAQALATIQWHVIVIQYVFGPRGIRSWTLVPWRSHHLVCGVTLCGGSAGAILLCRVSWRLCDCSTNTSGPDSKNWAGFTATFLRT